MVTEFKTGVGEGESGEEAGRSAAEVAFAQMDADRVDFTVAYSSPSYDSEAVIAGVRSITGDAILVGATAQGKFTERGVHTSAFRERQGVAVALVASDEMRFFTGLGYDVSEDAEAAVAEAAAELPTEVDGFPHLTGLLLSSAPIGREELAQLTYQQLPIQWGGGGANDPTLSNISVFMGDKSVSDAVVLTVIASKQPVALGVGNRHRPIDGSVEVTKSDGNVVYELDGQPAYEVWKDVFEETARDRYGIRMDEIEQDRRLVFQAFTEMVFGIRTGEDEYKIRSAGLTPLFEPYTELGMEGGFDVGGLGALAELPTLGSIPDGALQFAEPIPEGMVLYPMTSGKEGTIERGVRSVQQAMDTIPKGQIAGGLVFECPCGEATLQEDYHKLIEAVSDPVGAPIAGIQSGGGEICFRRDDMRGVHHTSTTLLLFPQGEAA